MFLLAAQPAGADIALSLTNVMDALADVQGGLRRGSALLDKLDLTATYGGPEDFSVFFDIQASDAADFSSSIVGDAQTVSSIDAPAGLRVLDAWFARDFAGRAGFKTGIVDLNSEFDVQQTGALFLNSAHGIGPDFSQSGDNGPSIFPSTGLGLVGWWLPANHWQVKAGVFEDTPGDPGHPGRTDLSLSNDKGVLAVFEARDHLTPDVVIGAGAWNYSATGQSGAYAIADGVLAEGLSGWVRAGVADGGIAASLGGGLVYTHEKAQAGVAFSHAGGETAIEATCAYAFGPALTVQPDLQYVISPGGGPGDALVVGSRITLVL
jgi:porin